MSDHVDSEQQENVNQQPQVQPTVTDDEQQEGASEAAPAAENSEVEELRQQVSELDEKWKRSVADYQNFKRQQEKDRQDWVAFANAALLKDLLPRMDELDQAFDHAPEEVKATKWFDGLSLVRKNMHKTLDDIGVEIIQPDGEEFSPHVHEAVAQESSDEHQSGTVISTMQKGYSLKGKVIRPAMVKVAE